MGSTGASCVVSLLCCLLVIVAFSDSVTAQPSNTSIDAIIPPSLVISASNVHVQRWLFGVGEQIYTYNGSAWLLTNVSADLYDSRGTKVGHHFFLGQLDSNGGRATWITFNPPTRVSGKTLVSVPSPFPISGLPKDSIPWLLVQATSNDGTQRFLGSTTYVQRIFTHGGLAPVGIPASTGDLFGSNYTALYKFSDNTTSAIGMQPGFLLLSQ